MSIENHGGLDEVFEGPQNVLELISVLVDQEWGVADMILMLESIQDALNFEDGQFGDEEIDYREECEILWDYLEFIVGEKFYIYDFFEWLGFRCLKSVAEENRFDFYYENDIVFICAQINRFIPLLEEFGADYEGGRFSSRDFVATYDEDSETMRKAFREYANRVIYSFDCNEDMYEKMH